jgi:hypothetical protein
MSLRVARLLFLSDNGGTTGENKMLKDLIESKAIYFFIAGTALAVLSLVLDYSMFEECRAHGFSLMYCLLK